MIAIAVPAPMPDKLAMAGRVDAVQFGSFTLGRQLNSSAIQDINSRIS